MNQSLVAALIAVVVVAVLGLLMRRMSAPSTPAMAPPPPEPEVAEEEEEAEEPEDGSAEAVAITSDGWSFVPVGDRDRVQLVAPLQRSEFAPPAPRPGAEQMSRGDLIVARVRRGAPDHDPWRLEALGRDREYRAWRFETEEAARAALALVQRSIVRTPRDEDGMESAVSDDEFDAARRLEAAIEAELASMPDVEDEPGDPLRRPVE